MYYIVGSRLRNIALLAASLFFYTWGEGGYVLLMLTSIVLNYLFGLAIEYASSYRRRVIALSAAVTVNLLILFYFKYFNFVIENINLLALHLDISPLQPIESHLPIGISFFTFQALSYIIDIFRKTIAVQHNPLKLGLYIASFPQLIAGPIVRYHDVAKQLEHRQHTLDDIAIGVERFICGLGKKVLIANVMAEMADHIFAAPSSELSISTAWLGIACYTMQIYIDFSGYSDMAIGLGRIFGFRFLENFNYPYFSQSIREFWQRWHISLSNWFRDYLYIPLGGNRVSPLRTYINLLIVFILCGSWHGASWNFLVWGLMHGLFIALERWKLATYLALMPPFIRHLYTMLIVIVGWVFFRAETMEQAFSYLGAMLGIGSDPQVNPWILNRADNLVFFTLAVAIVFSVPSMRMLYQKVFPCGVVKYPDGSRCSTIMMSCRLVSVVGILIFSSLSLASGTYNPFIYFRF